MDILLGIAAVAIGYLLGGFPTAYIVARLRKGIDIREVGVRNMGAGNIIREIGKMEGAVVSIVDIGKGTAVIYIAQALPLTIFILSQFFRQVPIDLKDAARIDGASEYRIFALVVPLVRPALGAIGIFTMIPIWNDLWFPLVISPSTDTATVTLGVQQFLGQFVSDWNAVLSSLTLAMVPILLFYLVFSKQLIRSITAGAIK